MESAARAAGIADSVHDPDLEAAREPQPGSPTPIPNRRSSASRALNNALASPTGVDNLDDAASERVPLPTSGRRSSSRPRSARSTRSGRRTPTASVRTGRSRTGSLRTLDGGGERPEVPALPAGAAGFLQYRGQEGAGQQGQGQLGQAPAQAQEQYDYDYDAGAAAAHEIGEAVTTAESDDGSEDDTGELAWNAQHPCWPHPNAHVPLSSPLYASTRVIRVARDFRVAGDLYPAFSALYPEILEPFLPQTEFKGLVRTVNQMCERVFDPYTWRNVVDACVGLATGWVSEDLGVTGVKRGMKKMDGWLKVWNERVGRQRGVEVVSLRRTAFLSIDIVVPDPSAWVVTDGADAEGEGQGAGEIAGEREDMAGRSRTATMASDAAYSGFGPASEGRRPEPGYRLEQQGGAQQDARSMTERTSLDGRSQGQSEWDERTQSMRSTDVGTSGSFRGSRAGWSNTPVPSIPVKFLGGER